MDGGLTKWGRRWTTASGASEHFSSSNLIQPTSPCCLLPSHAMELHAESRRLLEQVLGWKARPICPFGQAIEFRVCTQRCVCVGGLACRKMGVFWRLQQEGVNNAKKAKGVLKREKIRTG